MKITIASFKGMIPGLHPRLLPEDHAVEAKNVRLDDGALTPTRLEREVHRFDAPVGSFFLRPDGVWLGFAGVVNAASGASNDSRTYVTGNGSPQIWLSGSEVVALRLPPPATAPGVALVSGTIDPNLSTESVYAYTIITDLGEESSPSPVSDLIELQPGVTIRVSGLPASAPDPARRQTGLRIYRSVTDAMNDTRLFFVAEIGFQATYDDAIPVEVELVDTVEEIPSMDYDMPPDDMAGIVTMPNGMMVAFHGQEVLFCEPYVHHAWPNKYRLKVDSKIVGLAAFGSSVAILTEGMPYVAQGTHPETMVMEKIEVDLPCIAARGIVDLGYSVIYPSTDGLVQISPQGAAMMSGQMFTREMWVAMRPETFVASRLRGRYVFSYRPVAQPHELDEDVPLRLGIVDTSGAQPFFINDDARFDHLYYHVRDGSLYGLFLGQGVVKWDDLLQPRKRMSWRSKEVHLPTPTNFGCVRIDCDDDMQGELLCRVWAGPRRRQKLVREIKGRNVVERLPSGFTEDIWQIEVEGNVRVTAIFMAHAPSELSGG